jgi:hypothetical protein
MKKSKRRPPAFQILSEVRALREDLGAGQSAVEICARRRWTRWTYRQRMRVARKMAEQEYNPERFFDIFLRYEARYRALQRQAAVLADVLLRYVRDTKRPGLRQKCHAAHAWAAVTRLIAEWEDKVIAAARSLGVIPAVPPQRGGDPKVSVTLDQLIKASIDEYGVEAHEIPDTKSLPGDAGDKPRLEG